MDYIQRAKKFKTKKRLGQNFLVDEEAISTIIETANLKKDDVIVEIGPGAGFVTENVAPLVEKLYAIELDSEACDLLCGMGFSNVEIFLQDILQTNLRDFLDKKAKIIANIPYYITSPILVHLLGEIDEVSSEEIKNREMISEIVLMVQYEVAKRIVATPDSPNKEYGLLSILSNFWAVPELIKKVPAKSFYPAPKVDSAIVKMTIRKEPLVQLENPQLFKKIIKAAFAQRRKTLINALSQVGFDKLKILSILNKMQLKEDIRGEKLSIFQFADFCSYYEKGVDNV